MTVACTGILPLRPMVRQHPGDNWELCEDTTYAVCYDARGYDIKIPKGFVADGASNPRFLWRVAGHPAQYDTFVAMFVHDYLFRVVVNLGSHEVTLEDSAVIYCDCMEICGASGYKKFVHRAGVTNFIARSIWDSYR